MKLNTFALVFVLSFISSMAVNACETVMGGCTKEQAHDTSSHMKSQIVNQVTHSAPALVQTNSTSKTKSNTTQAKGSSSIVKAINKTVLK